MLEQGLIEILTPILQEWPTVAILLAIGLMLYRQYQTCQTELKDIIDWQQHIIDQMFEHAALSIPVKNSHAEIVSREDL